MKLVKTKTPKLTLYTERAKCVLMENGPVADFVVSFYDGQLVNQLSRRLPSSVPKLQCCLGVRVENLSSKKMARLKILEQNLSF